ncbi:MAG TPA: hypothetical protein VEB66_15450 [Opitutaceae bacterium]|nr:hypothetical protein [Opitutaceae bacterium]
MTLDGIKELLHGSLPFKLRMVSGRIIEIPHPDFVALSPSGTSIVYVHENDRMEIIRINQIESFELPGKSTAA